MLIRFLCSFQAPISWTAVTTSTQWVHRSSAIFINTLCWSIEKIKQFLGKYIFTYIGCTSQHLEVKVEQHVPRDICNHTTSGHSKLLDSTICEHLNALNSCGVDYSNSCFVALHRARTKQHFFGSHLYRVTPKKQNPYIFDGNS